MIQPYLSIDIETTGLDPEHDQILEIGAVYDDGKELKMFRKIAKLERVSGSPFAMHLNSSLLKEMISNAPELSVNPVKDLNNWLNHLFYNTNLEGKPITLAGKNIANFDLKFLLKAGFNYPYRHRIIDIGSVYFSDFYYVPSLDEINQLLGLGPVKHNALDDAINVVKALRAKCGVEYEQ